MKTNTKKKEFPINEWFQFIHQKKYIPLKSLKEIKEPVNFAEWLQYIRQQRNSPYR